MTAPTNARELWGHDVERDVGAIWGKLHALRLAPANELRPHRKGLRECQDLLEELMKEPV